jgi:hypothetical protein
VNEISESRPIVVSPDAIAQAKLLGIGGDRDKRLRRMARRSAPLTHDKGNRRFGDFVLQVSDRMVIAINKL